MDIFYRNRGTISVFLTLILIPVLLLGGMTTDAARICMSKVVISDAGEMAMNAALAQYNESLHDEYGLLVMDQSPNAMESELEQYFNGSLNESGLCGEEEYRKILDLLTERFHALDVQGSEIYRTEVEKQQILEYMKYRAPVCLTELVVKKLKELKDTKKMAEAMKKQMEFSETMEDCHNEFQKAKEKLDILDGLINNLKPEEVRRELADTKDDYEKIVSTALLMWAATQKYDDRLRQSAPEDMEGTAKQFLVVAKSVDLSAPYTSSSFNGYLSSMYYMNTIQDMGGIAKLLDETAADGSEELKAEYEKEEERIKDYQERLLTYASAGIEKHYQALKGYWDSAKAAKEAAKEAYNRLDKVKKELEKAKKAYDEWEKAEGALKDAGKDTGSMGEDVKKYHDFFYSDNGNGSSDLSQLKELMSDVEKNQDYFRKLADVLEGEKFWDESIAKKPASEQYDRYKKEASSLLSGKRTEDYDTYGKLERIREEEFIRHYQHKDISEAGSSVSISDHPFYKRLQEYCDESKKEDSRKQQDEANGRLEQSRQAGEEAKKADEYPKYDWSLAEAVLPSSVIGNGASDVSDSLADLDAKGDVNRSSTRKETTKKFKGSIDAAASFLDRVDEIVTTGLENLYISEYAMQMFSYYTVNKKDGQARPDGDVIGISGYRLQEHAAYQAECEYILWGKNASQENVKSTIMMIFGIRLLFNSFFAFTDNSPNGIGAIAGAAASAITGAAPYLQPIVKVVLILGFAGVETADDISKLKQGYGVTILKDSDTWATFPYGKDNTDKSRLTFDYSEYLRVFLNLSMLTESGVGILGRIADCIQVNQKDLDLMKGYTMVSVQAEVRSRTTFMRKISDWGDGGSWGFPEDTYTISYQSILGY